MNGRFVIDNSIILTWCFGDQADAYADTVLDSLTAAGAVVPAVWPIELVDALLAAERRQRLREEDSDRFLSLLGQLPIIIDQRWPSTAMRDLIALDRAYHLSSYEAAYLDLALRESLPIATLNERMLQTGHRLRIPLYKPAHLQTLQTN